MSTAAVSTGLKRQTSKFSAYIKYRIKAARTRQIMLIVFNVLSFPMAAIATNLVIYSWENRAQQLPTNFGTFSEIAMVLLMLAVFSLGAICVLTYINGVTSFQYLYSRTSVDMNYSLPLTRKERFWGDFIAGIAPTAVMYAASSVVALIILLPYSSLWEKYNLEFIPYCFVIGFVALMFLYIYVVFSTSLSGRFFEAAVYPVVLSVIVPLVIVLVYELTFSHRMLDYSTELQNLFSATSPLGFLGIQLGKLISDMRLISFANNVSNLSIWDFVWAIAVMAGLAIASYYLNKKRSTERTGMPFAFKISYHVYLSLMMFCLVMLFFLNWSVASMTAMIIFTAVGFLLVEIITKRRFQKMHIVALRYVVTILISVALCYVMAAVDSFGLWRYIPEADEIESVSFSTSIDGSDNVFTLLDYDPESGEFSSHHNGVNVSDPANIAAIHSIHQKNIEYYQKKGSDSFMSGRSVNCTYYLKNGKVVTRYLMMDNVDLNAVSNVFSSDEIRALEMKALGSLLDIDSKSGYLNSQHGGASLYISGNELVEIYKALEKEYVTAKDRTDYLCSITFNGKRSMNFRIYSSYVNTVELLESKGYDLENSLARFESYDVTIYVEREYADEPMPSYYYDHDFSVTIPAGTWQNNNRVLTLLEAMVPDTGRISTGYHVGFGYQKYVVPQEYMNLALELMREYGGQEYEG